ncbi:MAG TPA: phosphotransferase [Ktedonobacterales bacterium]|nr:phosphotransferase [Ktedonobacterales bacterium]
MIDTHENTAFEGLARRLFPRGVLLRAWPLQGGVSARMTALGIEDEAGSVQKVIVRQHGPADRARNPDIAHDEFLLLTALRAAGLPSPTPLDFDETGELLGGPGVVIEYIEGETDFAPAHRDNYLQQFAAQLARIHRVDVSAYDLAFLPLQAETWARIITSRPERLDDSLNEGRIRDALEAVWPWPQRNPSRVLHGDYWPGNILWRDGRLVGIIDWEDAALGDPLADLAISRLDMLWALDMEAMERFTEIYVSLTGIDLDALPCWDLCAALRPAGQISAWASSSAIGDRMRERHRTFVARAFERLAAR